MDWNYDMDKQSIQAGKYILLQDNVLAGPKEEQNITVEPVINTSTCTTCKSGRTIFDGSSGETICTSCGTVLMDKQESRISDMITRNQTGMPGSLVVPDKGLFTIITRSNIDANGTLLNQAQIMKSNKIRYLDKILSNNRNYLRNFKNAFAIMATIGDKLALTNPVIERAAYYYRKAFENKLIKGRAIKEMVVASIYASCKETKIPRTLQEIANAANADPVFSGRCYRTMSRKLKINPPVLDATSYISKIATKAQISQRTYREALDMLNDIKKHSICHGKDPRAVAAAILYASCLKRDEPHLSQLRIAKAGDLSIVTLRKRFADILKISDGINYRTTRHKVKSKKVD